MSEISAISAASFFCGIALMYLVMSRTYNKRRMEEDKKGLIL